MIVESIHCPNCGAPNTRDAEVCEFCCGALYVRSFVTLAELNGETLGKFATSYAQDAEGDMNAALSAALCNFGLGLYDRAAKFAQNAIDADPTNGDAYYYYALSLLDGQRPFVHAREQINTIERYLTTAAKLSGRADILLTQAFVRYDYYTRKSLYVSPDFVPYLIRARQAGLTKKDAAAQFALLKVPFPNEMFALATEQ